MVLFPSFFNGLARTVSSSSSSLKRGKSLEKESAAAAGGGGGGGKEAAEELAKDAKRNELILSSSGIVKSTKSNNFASVCSRRGQKGVNQDCLVVWEEFGCQEDLMFCGVFDGHGPWGHVVAKKVRESVPPSLLCNWQQTLQSSLDMEMELGLLNQDGDLLHSDQQHRFEIWKESYLKTYDAVDHQLKLQHPKVDTFFSGTTALTIVKQRNHLVIANVGDSRAVLATTSDDGSLSAVQLTVDFKPNLPQEAERIKNSKGRVFCLQDEPGVYRVWRPSGKTPGLAISRAFGDYCIKEFGLISIPDVTQMSITSRDQFVILASDGVWDVVSNQDAVRMVAAVAAGGGREKCARRLVEFAARAWKRKRGGVAMDDMSAICLFFHEVELSSSVAIVSSEGEKKTKGSD